MNPSPSPNTDKTNALLGTYEQNIKFVQMDRNDVGFLPLLPGAFPPADDSHPYVLAVYESMPILSYAFLKVEAERECFGLLQEANLVGRLLTAFGDASLEHYCIAGGHGKQILGTATYTKELGFLCSYLDYGSSDNYSADVKNVSVNHKIYYSLPTVHVPLPPGKQCGQPNTTSSSANGAITLYNPSACQMSITYTGFYNPSIPFWSISGTPTLNAYSSDNSSVTVTYTPAIYCQVLNMYPDIHTVEFSGSSPWSDSSMSNFIVGNKITSSGASILPDFSFTAWPDPATDKITISLSGCRDIPLTLALYNILGERIMASDIRLQNETESVPFALTGVSPGTYVIRISTGDGVLGQQFISVVK